MSDDGARNLDVFQEEDRVDGHKALALIVAVLIVVVGCSVVAWALLRTDQPPGTAISWKPSRVDERLGPSEVRGIRQTLIDEDVSTAQLSYEQHDLVDSYGWVDRSSGIVHIPVERAMTLLIARGSTMPLPPAEADTISALQAARSGGTAAPNEARDTTGGDGAS